MTIPLILMIGLPGSGKSFAAQKLHHYHFKCPLISTDQIRQQLFGNEAIQGAWLKVWREVETQLRLAVTQIQQQQAPLAIYDATNAARRQRKEAIRLARTVGFNQIIGYWLDPPLKTCLQRNQERDRQVPEEIIQKMNRQLTDAPPSLSDGLDRLIHTLSPVLI